MVDPLSLSLLAGAVTTYIVPKALEKVGEKVGETALTKSGEAIQAVRRVVQEKLKATQTDGLLTMAKADPAEPNLKLLETVLLGQMQQDPNFVAQLQALVQQIQSESPAMQVVLDTVRVRGNVEIGDVKQESKTGPAEQVVGRNLGVGGDLKLGDISQQQ